MRIVDVRTVLLTGPSTNDPYLGRTRRSAAFIEILTDTELTGLGETYAGYFIPEAIPSIVDFYRPILLDQTVDDVPALAARLFHTGRYWAQDRARSGGHDRHRGRPLGPARPRAGEAGPRAARRQAPRQHPRLRDRRRDRLPEAPSGGQDRLLPRPRLPGVQDRDRRLDPRRRGVRLHRARRSRRLRGRQVRVRARPRRAGRQGAARRAPGQPADPRLGGADRAGRRQGGRAVRPVPVRGAAALHRTRGATASCAARRASRSPAARR